MKVFKKNLAIVSKKSQNLYAKLYLSYSNFVFFRSDQSTNQ